jgi:ribosomal-protein-alanine N-acetyltransferase
VIILETERLILETLTPEDAPFALELLNDPAFVNQIGDRGVRTLEDATHYLVRGPIQSYALNGFAMYRVKLKTSGETSGETPSETSAETIGMCGLVTREGLHDVDVGFAFLPKFWSMGYATESALAVLEYGRVRIGLKRIVGITSPGNQASIRVLEKIGMKYEGLVTLPREGSQVKLFGITFK